MASKKQVEIGLTLKALNKTKYPLQEMQKDIGNLGRKARKDFAEISKARGPVSAISDFRKAQKEARGLSEKVNGARRRVDELTQAQRKSGKATKGQAREIAGAKKALGKLEAAHKKARSGMNEHRKTIKAMGVDVKRLGEAEKGYAQTVEEVTRRTEASWDRRQRKLEAIERRNKSLRKARNTALTGGAVAYTGVRLAQAVANPVKRSIDEEAAFTQVQKVAGFESEEEKKAHRRASLRATRRLPVAIEDLYDIQSIAANAGIKKENLVDVSTRIAQVKTAFDMDAYGAGDAFAKIKAGMALSNDETFGLMDTTNYLSNKYAAKASEVVKFIKNSAGDQRLSGVGRESWAGLGTAMIAGGAEPEVAATSARNMVKSLTKGVEAGNTRRMRGFAELGIDPAKVQKEMQRNAEDTILRVLEVINNKPAEQQQSLIFDVFGEEARGLTPVAADPSKLKAMWIDANDTAAQAGSVAKEAAIQARTTKNKIQLFFNKLDEMKIKLGQTLLPALNGVLDWVNNLLDKVNDWIENNETLAGTIMKVSAAVAGAVTAFGSALVVLAGVRAAGALGSYGAGLFGLGGKRGGLLGGLFGGKAGKAATGAKGLAGKAAKGGGFAAAAKIGFLGYMAADYNSRTNMMMRKPGESDEEWSARTREQHINRNQGINEWLDGTWFGSLHKMLGGQSAAEITDERAKKFDENLEKLSAAAEQAANRLDATAVARTGFLGIVPGSIGKKSEGARALGGGVRAGGLYRINESGEEFFSPGVGGQVISNATLNRVANVAKSVQGDASRAVGSVVISPTISQTITSNSADPLEVAMASKDAISQVITELVNEALLDNYANVEAV